MPRAVIRIEHVAHRDPLLLLWESWAPLAPSPIFPQWWPHGKWGRCSTETRRELTASLSFLFTFTGHNSSTNQTYWDNTSSSFQFSFYPPQSHTRALLATADSRRPSSFSPPSSTLGFRSKHFLIQSHSDLDFPFSGHSLNLSPLLKHRPGQMSEKMSELSFPQSSFISLEYGFSFFFFFFMFSNDYFYWLTKVK